MCIATCLRARFGNNRGGVLIRMALVIVTFAILGTFIVVLLNKRSANQKFNHTIALRLADEGFQAAMSQLFQDPESTKGIPRTERQDGWYRVDMVADTTEGQVYLSVKAIGGSGSMTRDRTIRVMRAVEADSTTPWEPVSPEN